MHEISDLADILGLNENQVRNRLTTFNPILKDHIRRGDKNKILVDNNGLAILRRGKELENEKSTLKEVLYTLEKEIGSNGDKSDEKVDSSVSRETVEVYKSTIKQMEKEIERLEKIIERRDHQVDSFQRIIENRLPPAQKRQSPSMFTKFVQLIHYMRSGEPA